MPPSCDKKLEFDYQISDPKIVHYPPGGKKTVEYEILFNICKDVRTSLPQDILDRFLKQVKDEKTGKLIDKKKIDLS